MKARNGTAVGGSPVSIRCPSCRQVGVFHVLASQGNQRIRIEPANVVIGIHVCPNVDCQACVYVVTDLQPPGQQTVLATFPPELLEFDPTNIPTEVREALEEAIKCHSQDCFTAAAIMVRKTLEELCQERGATGGNLKERIVDLGSKVVLPKELLDGLDDLRLLGNDAAHIESRVFNGIGKEEVEIGIEFATEVLKAVYQYAGLLSRLRALKAQHATE